MIENFKIDFLIDSGADASVLPSNIFKPNNTPTTKRTLLSANNSVIEYYGEREASFNIPGFKNSFTWIFAVANINRPILGADFLANFDLVVSCKDKRILNSGTSEFSQGINKSSLLCNITSQYEEVLKVKKNSHDHLQAANMELSIKTQGEPVSQKSRKLFGERLRATREEFDKLLKDNVIRISNSCWASPLVLVRKRDGSWRPCGDYRLLNTATIPDKYPLPRIQDILDGLNGSRIYSKLDLTKAYHQIPIAEEDIHKTAVITPFGLYEYRKMPFGLRNAAQTFQRHIDNILRGCQSFCLSYVDDILIFSKTLEEHTNHVKSVLTKITSAGLEINIKKCEFNKEQIQFLGFDLCKDGIRPSKDRISDIIETKQPTNIRMLRGFIGAVGYYHWLIANLSHLMAPLHDLVTIADGDKRKFTWNQIHEKAFQSVKSALCEAVPTGFPNPNLPFVLSTDASSTAVGGSLNQRNADGNPIPIAFFSRKLSKSEINYSTFDRELLAIRLAVKHFRHYLLGSKFTVETDHKPLVNIMQMKEPSSRQWRTIEFLSQFSFSIEYIKGKDNVVADLLSRQHAVDETPVEQINSISLEDLSKEQKADPSISNLDNSSLILLKNKDGILIDTSTGSNRIVLPKIFRFPEFLRLHQLSHPGYKPMAKLITTRYVWPRMRSDIRSWNRMCLQCQRSKISRHTKSPLGTIPINGRFKTIHVDLVGPLPPVMGKRYILTIIDRSTSWMEAIPLNDISSACVIKTIEREWISRYGVPEIVITDQGLQFDSSTFNAFCTKVGIDHKRTTAYHPQCNGKVERWHRSLKNSLRAHADDANKTWVNDLPLVLLGLRNCCTSNDSPSPAERVFGYQLRMPGDTITEETAIEHEEDIDQVREAIHRHETDTKIRKANEVPSMQKELNTCNKVWLLKPVTRGLDAPYEGPFQVLERSTDLKTFTISINDKAKKISVDRLRATVEDCSSSQTGVM